MQKVVSFLAFVATDSLVGGIDSCLFYIQRPMFQVVITNT